MRLQDRSSRGGERWSELVRLSAKRSRRLSPALASESARDAADSVQRRNVAGVLEELCLPSSPGFSFGLIGNGATSRKEVMALGAATTRSNATPRWEDAHSHLNWAKNSQIALDCRPDPRILGRPELRVEGCTRSRPRGLAETSVLPTTCQGYSGVIRRSGSHGRRS